MKAWNFAQLSYIKDNAEVLAMIRKERLRDGVEIFKIDMTDVQQPDTGI